MDFYAVKKLKINDDIIKIDVPASKSILNRAIILAALAKGAVRLNCGSYAQDTKALILCMQSLGIKIEAIPTGLVVYGCGGNIPNKKAELNVESAGTAARFLTAVLAFCGGEYEFTSSAQMARRPMEILPLLKKLGVKIEYGGEKEHFPFRMISGGVTQTEIQVNTDESTQYASGLLLAASAAKSPVTLTLSGSRTNGSYIYMTLALLKQFGIPVEKNGNAIKIFQPYSSPAEIQIEPDISGACYFYALSLLCGAKVLVRGVRENSLQGDYEFINLLKARGVLLSDTPEGLLLNGSGVTTFAGFEEDLQNFSDQALTVAALAPFASSPTVIKNVGHIRLQECDRVAAIQSNLTALGVPVSVKNNDIYIQPAKINGGVIKTFYDHRVAMAFTLIGLKTGNIKIENPSCSKKTFENFFKIIDEITK